MCFSGENGCLNQVERNDLHVHDVVFVSESWEKVHRTVKPVYKGSVYSGDPVYYSHWTIFWKFCLTFSVMFTHIWQSPVTPRQKERQNTCNRKSMTDQKHLKNFKFRWNFMQVHGHLLSILLIYFYPYFLKAPEWSCPGNP